MNNLLEYKNDEVSPASSQLSYQSIVSEFIELNIGQNHPDWISFKKGFKSEGIYQKRIDYFIYWLQTQTKQIFALDETLVAKLKAYIDFEHEEVREVDGVSVPKWAPTAFRSWMSMFDAFFLHTGQGKLKQLAPLIYSNLTKWETGYEETHAKEFEKDDLLRLHDDSLFPPSTPMIKLYRAYSSIACANASRSGGLWKRDFDSIVALDSKSADKENFSYPEYKVMYVREKKRGKVKNIDKDQLITGLLERKV